MQTLSNGGETYGHGTLLPCLAFTSAEAEISPSLSDEEESEDEKRREVTPNGCGDFQAEVAALLVPGIADPKTSKTKVMGHKDSVQLGWAGSLKKSEGSWKSCLGFEIFRWGSPDWRV